MEELDSLKLENQICFPLYVCSKEIIKRYKPFLDEIHLTYTQYITMMVLWDKKEVNVKELGEYLYLDSGTLTPLLKKLENKKYINRVRSKKDERNLIISITELGMELKNKAKDIPSKISKCIEMEGKDAIELYKLLHKILLNFKD
ncbi:MAG: MarR family transcriptional regulator [Clostridia bacterium]|nr:MarR family transcriptional regulator [Clostridia bacterium]